jgi:hypothetical protein
MPLKLSSNLAMPLALATMDACWIFAITWMVQQIFLYGMKPYHVPNPLILALLWFASWWITGLALNSSLPLGLARVLALAAGVLATLGLLLALYPPDPASSIGQWISRGAFTFIVCLGVWSLGSYRTTDSLDFSIAFKTFIFGLAIMGFSFIFATVMAARELTGFNAGTAGTYLPGVSPIPMWFVGASLVAMAMGNRELVRRETGSTQTRFWTPVLVGCVLFVLLISILGGAVSFESMLSFVRGAIAWTAFALGYLIHTVLLFIFSIFNTDIPYFRRMPRKPTAEPSQTLPDPYEELRRQFYGMGDSQPPVDLQNILTLTALALLFVVMLVVLVMVGRRLRRTREDRVKRLPEDRESFGSWALLRQQVGQWWSNLLARFFPKRRSEEAASALDELEALRGNPNLSGTLSVRQIYARLQAAAARIGYPRPPQQTPLEYLDVLSRAMPHLRPDFAAITSAYIEARYSPLPASAPAVTSATNAWKHAEPQLTSPGGTNPRN